jgi:hypothetical protein
VAVDVMDVMRCTRIVLAVLAVGLAFPMVARADQSALTVSNVNFGDQAVGTSSSEFLTVKNQSSASVFIHDESLATLTSKSGFSFLGLTDTCFSTWLPSSAVCRIEISFAPSDAGVVRGQFCVNDAFCTIVKGHAS